MVAWPVEPQLMPAFLDKNAESSKASSLTAQGVDEADGEEEEHGRHSENSNPSLPFIPRPHAPPTLIYSLSSGAPIASSTTRSRSRPISPESPSSFTPSTPLARSSSFLHDNHDARSANFELSPVNPFDYMKTLLSQLATSIAAMKTAYAHQQAALNPYNMPHTHQGRESSGSDISAADKGMVENLKMLSHLHLQLTLLPHMKQVQWRGREGAEEEEGGVVKEEMLKRYEGIITQFHDEIRRKDTVTQALKETLARSMLRGEKLEGRVRALEAKFRAHSYHRYGTKGLD